MKKKGYIPDLAFFGFLLVVFIIVILLWGRIQSSYTEKYSQINASSEAAGLRIMQQHEDRYSVVWDYVFLATIVFFAIGLFISFFMIDTHPAFFFIALIMFVFIIIVNAILGNVFEAFTGGQMAGEAAKYDITGYIMDNWVLYIVVLGMVAIGLLFAKMKTSMFRFK